MPDYSCYITLTNNSPYPMYFSNDNIVDGHYATNPPSAIPAGQSGSWQLQDNAGPVGSEGFCYYNVKTPSGSTVSISMHYSCPVWSSNIYACTSSNPLVVSTTNTSSGTSGHPLTASSVVNNSALTTSGLLGFVPKETADALKSSDGKDEAAWKDAEAHLEQMKNAARWGVAA